jgi:predicted AAA+ superfamily ATPase
MYFERKQYLQQLTSAEGNGMIKIITGIRRCGKSYLLFNIYKQHLLLKGVSADHIIEVKPRG